MLSGLPAPCLSANVDHNPRNFLTLTARDFVATR